MVRTLSGRVQSCRERRTDGSDDGQTVADGNGIREEKHTLADVTEWKLGSRAQRSLETPRIVALLLMVGRREMFGVVVRQVGSARGPIEIKVRARNAIFEPVVAHVKSFGAFHAHFGSENVMSSGVVGFKGSAGSGLFMTQFSEGSNERNGFLTVEKQAASFCFSG